jgi:hypothetical protein
MEDKEILQWFASHEGSACGRLRPDQLNRPMVTPPERKTPWRYWHYLIAGLLFSSKVSAQTKPAAPPTSQHVSPKTNNHVALEKINDYEPVEINVKQLPTTNQLDMAPVIMLQGMVGDVVIYRRRKPKADTTSIFKDTLATFGLLPKSLTIYPNPVAKGNAVTVSARLDQAGTYTIQLFSISGVLMQTTQVNGAPKTPKLSMTIPANLTPGTYIVRVSHPALTKSYSEEVVVF